MRRRDKIILGLILVAVIIIVFFMKLRTKANYAIPDSTATAADDRAFYLAYSGAQSDFANTVGAGLTTFSSITGTPDGIVSVTTNTPHSFAVGSNVIVGGILGNDHTGFNSNISIGNPITINQISGNKGGTVTVSTGTVKHNLYNGALINIQGNSTYDTQPNCSVTANQPRCVSQVVNGTTLYINPLPSATAVPVTVTSPTTFTYTDPNIPAGTGLSGATGTSTGVIVPSSGIPIPFQVTTVDDSTHFKYTSPGLSGTPPTSNGWAFNAGNTSYLDAYLIKDTTISTASNTWISRKCPYLTGTPITDNGYLANVSAINNAYAGVVNNAYFGGAGVPSIGVVNAARKADLTIPLRMYLSRACPGIYADSRGDIGTIFAGFTTLAQAFNSSAITNATVLTWATYAAVNPSAASAAATTPLVPGSTIWTTMLTEPVTNVSLPAYQVAKNYGPGAAVAFKILGSS